MSDLAIIPAASLVPADVFKPGGVDDVLERIAKAARAEKPDVSTRQGRKEIASLALKVAKSKTHLDEMGKDLAADWKAQANRVDAERRKVRDFLDALKEEIREPLTKYEQDEAARVQAHELALDVITDRNGSIATDDATAAEWSARLDTLRNWPARDWQEFAQKAADILAAEITRTEQWHAAAVKREAEAAELARLRAEQQERDRQEAIRLQAEREARIAAEAAEKARLAAEAEAHRLRAEELARVEAEKAAAEAKAAAERKAAEEARAAEERRAREAEERAAAAERARIAAEAKAERDRLAAIEAAQMAEERAKAREAEAARKAEADRIAAVAAEQRRAAAAKAAEEAEAARRAANVAHKRKINGEVLAAMLTFGVSDDTAQVVIKAIVRGEIPHVSITY